MKTQPAILGLAAALFAQVASPAQDRAISNACLQLILAKSSEYVLAIPSEHKSVTVRTVDSYRHGEFAKKLDASWETDSHVGHTILPMVLRAAFAGNTNGQVALHLEVQGNGKTNSWQFSSTGTAESLYALRCLAPEQKWAQDLAAQIRISEVVSAISQEKHGELLRGGSSIAPGSEAGSGLLRAAKQFYNEHRAEILSKFGRGYLFYPPADKLDWNIRESGGEAYVMSGCHDRMFATGFIVQAKRNEDRHWAPKQIYVYSWFKGE